MIKNEEIDAETQCRVFDLLHYHVCHDCSNNDLSVTEAKYEEQKVGFLALDS